MSVSTFLNGRNPTQLRGLQYLSLSDTGQVLTRSFTSDTGGGGTQTWTAGTAVFCRLDPVASQRDGRITGGRIDERSTHVVTVPTGTSVTGNDRFAITGRGTFEVTATRDRTAQFAMMFEVIQVS